MNNKQELLKLETEYIIKELNNPLCVNTYRAYVSGEQKKEESKEYMESNKDYFKQKQREYYENNKDIISERSKKYREEHPELLSEQRKKIKIITYR